MLNFGIIVFVVNKKPQNSNTFFSGYYSDLDTDELKNLSPEEIFKSLILSKAKIDTTELTEKEIEEMQNEIVNKYLPLFMEVAKEVESGVNDADN